jgi:CDP-diacylglycerol--glycerol-3-phosphate 3-phosphatidyltransferase
VLICSVLVMLVQLGRVPAWIAIIIICRDLMVTGLRALAADKGIVIVADSHGKLKTVLQLLALAPLILHYDLFGIPLHSFGIFLLYIALALTVFSGCKYFLNFFQNWQVKESL